MPKLSEDEEKLRVCPSCDYSFCVFCRRGWHGTRNACALPQSSAIVSGYLSGDAEQRRTLEVRYGAANIKRLVAAYEEERALQEWLQAHSTQCPGCSARVEKSQGCNVSSLSWGLYAVTNRAFCWTMLIVSRAQTAHDLRQVRVALLLPLRQVDLAARPVQTLFDAGNDLLWQVVRFRSRSGAGTGPVGQLYGRGCVLSEAFTAGSSKRDAGTPVSSSS